MHRGAPRCSHAASILMLSNDSNSRLMYQKKNFFFTACRTQRTVHLEDDNDAQIDRTGRREGAGVRS